MSTSGVSTFSVTTSDIIGGASGYGLVTQNNTTGASVTATGANWVYRFVLK